MSFETIDVTPPSPSQTLALFNHEVDQTTDPYSLGKNQQIRGSIELFSDPIPNRAAFLKLHDRLKRHDSIEVIGNISDEISVGSQFILAKTPHFRTAGELAKKMGYRPARAGEFLQLMWWLEHERHPSFGWYYCYSGRKENFAILAEYNYHQKKNPWRRVIFDTYLGTRLQEDYVSANMDTHCLFVLVR